MRRLLISFTWLTLFGTLSDEMAADGFVSITVIIYRRDISPFDRMLYICTGGKKNRTGTSACCFLADGRCSYRPIPSSISMSIIESATLLYINVHVFKWYFY